MPSVSAGGSCRHRVACCLCPPTGVRAMRPVDLTAPAARFKLIDHNGHAVDQDSFHGSYALLFFGSVHWQLAHPGDLDKLWWVLASLEGGADRVRPLYVTMNPQHDTPGVMRTF